MLDLVPLWCHNCPMEKRKPHHDLGAFKRCFSDPATRRMTKKALDCALGMGFTV